MSLIGRRPRSVEDLPPSKPVRLPRAGDCFYCGRTLKTDYDAATHRCDRELFQAGQMFREGIGRVRV